MNVLLKRVYLSGRSFYICPCDADCEFHRPSICFTHMFEKETKEYYTGENLLQNGALLSIRHILEHRPGRKGSQQFQYGHVSYDIRKTTINEQQEITLKAITESGTEKKRSAAVRSKSEKTAELDRINQRYVYKKSRVSQHFIITE